jgi:hypothetical protein
VREQYRRECIKVTKREAAGIRLAYFGDWQGAADFEALWVLKPVAKEAINAGNEVYDAFIHVGFIGGPDVVVAADELLREVNRIAIKGEPLREARYGSLVVV